VHWSHMYAEGERVRTGDGFKVWCLAALSRQSEIQNNVEHETVY